MAISNLAIVGISPQYDVLNNPEGGKTIRNFIVSVLESAGRGQVLLVRAEEESYQERQSMVESFAVQTPLHTILAVFILLRLLCIAFSPSESPVDL